MSSTRTPRGRRGTAATLTAALAVLIFAAGAAEAISLAMHRRALVLSASSVARFGRDTRLGDTVVLTVSVVVAAVGIVLLLAALLPPRRRLIELREPVPTVAAGMTRRSLRRTLAAAATGVDGVSAATVRGRRRLTVKATTTLRDADALPDLVRAAVGERLDQLDPAVGHTVRVRLDREDD